MGDYTDDFTGPDFEPLTDPPWLVETFPAQFIYFENTAAVAGSPGPLRAVSLYETRPTSDDQYCQVTLVDPTVPGQATVYVRYSSLDDNYRADFDGTNLSLSATVGGVITELFSAPVAMVAGDTLRLDVEGDLLSVLVNGVDQIDWVDSSIATGPYVAIGATLTDAGPPYYQIDDFVGGPAPGGAAGPIGAAMDQIGEALGAIDGLRVFDFPPRSAQPPFAFVDMPERVDFDGAYQRGQDRATFVVVVAVADVVDRAARDAIAAYAAGAGASSIKAVLDAATIGVTARVTSVEFRPVSLAAGTYAGAIFDVDVVL